MPGTYLIVGASLTGAKAAQTLRDEGFDGRIVLVGDDPHRPYERPPLSKGYLQGQEDADAAYVHEADFYADQRIELLLGVRAARIDRDAHEVVLSAAEPARMPYEKLLIATGASPRRLAVPGGDDPGLYHLRTLDDSTRLRAALSDGTARVVVIGAGWIGLECAAAARGYGCPVTVVEPERTPLYRALGAEMGEIFTDLHHRNDVDLLLGAGVREIRRAGDAYTVVTSEDTELPADVVIVGVGARPNDELVREAGLATDDGVRVDAALRTADPDIHAAGDVANFYHPALDTTIRVEHWANAGTSGPAAARSMLGRQVRYDPVPYFFSDQYDLGMEFAGIAAPGEYDDVVVRGETAPTLDGAPEFVAFWMSRGRVVAGMNVNIWDVSDDIQALIRSAAPVDPDRLRDLTVPLSDLP